MSTDLLSGFNRTPYVRVETEAFPPACRLKERLRLPIPQYFVQQLNGRYFAILFAIFPDHALSQGLGVTIQMHKTDFPSV
jgi:hypothetical protein